MQRLINFILEYRNAFLYVVLTLISLIITVNSHSYHQSKYFNSAKWLTGSIYSVSNGIRSYFALRQENELLHQENEQLRLALFNLETSFSADTSDRTAKYTVTKAQVIKNSYATPRNYITIDKGSKDGITQDMGVITPLGILGIVENTSASYATVQSVLNTKSNINAKIKNTDHFGSLIWDAKRYNVVQLVDIPRSASLNVGDTITTGAMSSIFPENIPIGVIREYTLNQNQSSYTIAVSLFNDMTNIKNTYVVKNKDREEILELQKKTADVE